MTVDKESTTNTENNAADRQETLQKAMEQAMTFLEYRARTVKEMRQKLRDKGYDDPIIEDVILTLTEWRYLDDRNYAAEYIRFALERSRGLSRITRELAAKGIDKELVQQAVYDYEDEEQTAVADIELERARALALKSLRGKEWDKKMEARIGRKLAGAGYRNDIIYRILGELRRGEEDTWDDLS